MKIGIMTFHRAINYGAVLQTYALQKYLNDSGYDGYIDKTLYKYILHKNSHSNKDNNQYEKMIQRFKKQEETLYILIKSICDENDEKVYKNKLYIHFHRFYLRLANKYGMKQDLKKYYEQLKQVNGNGMKERIYYVLGIIGIKKR